MRPRRGRSVVATRRQARGLPGRVDTSDLHRNRGKARYAHQQHDDQACDTEGRLNRGTAGLVA